MKTTPINAAATSDQMREPSRRPVEQELKNHELELVSGGTKQRPDGTAGGNVAAKWSLTQGAAA
jgi:hypothetical protein